MREQANWANANIPEPRVGCNIYGDVGLLNHYPDLDESRQKGRRGDMPDLLACPSKSCKRLARIALINAALSKYYHCYLITTTHPLDWGIMQRRKALNELLDVIRKDVDVVGYVWATERHSKGESKGKIHHHLFVRCAERWDYRKVVVKWSKRYCGSPNGLDIRHRGAEGALYSGKMARYVGKDGTGLLPFRHWGSSKVVKQVEFGMWEYPTYVERRGRYGVPMLTIGQDCAFALAVEAQRGVELERLRRKNLKRLKALKRRMLSRLGRG